MESYIHVTETTYYVRGTRYYLLLYPLGTRYILLLLTDTRYIILILLSTYLGLAIALAHETSPHPHPYARILEVNSARPWGKALLWDVWRSTVRHTHYWVSISLGEWARRLKRRDLFYEYLFSGLEDVSTACSWGSRPKPAAAASRRWPAVS